MIPHTWQVPTTEEQLAFLKGQQRLVDKGDTWAPKEAPPWDKFIHALHGLFLATLHVCRARQDESQLCFPTKH